MLLTDNNLVAVSCMLLTDNNLIAQSVTHRDVISTELTQNAKAAAIKLHISSVFIHMNLTQDTTDIYTEASSTDVQCTVHISNMAQISYSTLSLQHYADAATKNIEIL